MFGCACLGGWGEWSGVSRVDWLVAGVWVSSVVVLEIVVFLFGWWLVSVVCLRVVDCLLLSYGFDGVITLIVLFRVCIDCRLYDYIWLLILV